ncbi:hypothetical protein Tco_0032256 [Tanacetum coccineum]
MATTDKESRAVGTDNRPPMLEESDFESWKIRIERYIRGKPLGKLIWKSIKNGPSPHPMIKVTTGEGEQQTQVTREKTDEEFTEAENNKERADIQATNILSQGLPRHIFNILNQTEMTKEIWENVELLMQGKYVTIVKNSKDISIMSYVDLYTHLKSYEQHALKTLSKMNQTSGNADPLAYMAKATQSTSSPSQYVPPPPQTSTNPTTQATIQVGQITIESVQRRASGNKGKHAATGSQGKVVTCYNFHGQGHVVKECKEKKRAKDSQWFKDKELPMKAKEKGAILDAEAEAFLADVECTTPYAEPLSNTTTTPFEVSHEDAYDSDVDEAPHAATAFMVNLMQTGLSTGQGTSNDTDFHSEVHTYDNHFFDNMNLQISQDVPTDVSSVIPGEISVITILDDLRSQLEGHIKTNEEQSFANDSLKAELERYKTQVQNLEQSKVKKDLEQLVFERNKRNADLEEQLVSLKQQLLQHVESNKSLKTESEKLKADKNALEESYLEELVWLRNTNKVVTELLQSYGQPVQTVPMLSKRPTFSTKDLHKSALGHRNPMYLKSAQLCRPALYLGDVIVDPVHTPFRVYDSEETLVQAEVSRTKMLERMKDPLCKVSSKPINYAKLNNICSVVLTFDIVEPINDEPRSNCIKEHSRNLELEVDILKMKQLLLKDQLQGKDELIMKLKAQIGNIKEVSADSSLSTLEFQALKTKNTQLKEELIAVRIKNDSLRDENVSIKKRCQDLYQSKIKSNSNVSSRAIVPKKPEVLAPGLYAMTPKYIPP